MTNQQGSKAVTPRAKNAKCKINLSFISLTLIKRLLFARYCGKYARELKRFLHVPHKTWSMGPKPRNQSSLSGSGRETMSQEQRCQVPSEWRRPRGVKNPMRGEPQRVTGQGRPHGEDKSKAT